MRAFTCAFILWSLIASAVAQDCDEDTIDTVSDDGEIITMLSGATFRVSSVDQVETALWLAADDVLICDDETEIINKDENNEHVSVRRIH